MKRNTLLLDLGSSPGGWSQVASKKITNGKILAVDIKDMKKINGVSFLKGDLSDIPLYTDRAGKEIKTAFLIIAHQLKKKLQANAYYFVIPHQIL